MLTQTILTLTVASLLLLLGLYSVYRLLKVFNLMDHEKAKMLAEQTELKRELEIAAAKAHTHSTLAGIEDTTAIAIDVAFGLKAEVDRVNTLISKLHKLREGPYAYDKNQKSGRRNTHVRLRL